MGLLKKSGSVDVIDIPELQKKGVLKRAGYEKYERAMTKENASGIKMTAGFVDLTSLANQQTENLQENNTQPLNLFSSQESQNNSPFAMLDNVARANNQESSYFSNNAQGLDVNTLKVKIDDLEYKLERLIEKIARIEESLGSR